MSLPAPRHFDAIYLSPHLDDAVLSCGGQIVRQTRKGAGVLVVTVTAGEPTAAISPYAAGLHARWEVAADAVAVRRAEDRAACAMLGAQVEHWAIPDCIYRLDPVTGGPYYVSDADIFGEIASGDRALIELLARQMQVLPPHTHLYAPLAVGHHVDHQLTRLAAERAFGAHHLTYYEDYPYAQQPQAVCAAVGCPPSGWQAEVAPIDPAAQRLKCEAVAAYRSQLSTFFVDRADLENQITGYLAKNGGERLWRPSG